jgi:hypothetical protein
MNYINLQSVCDLCGSISLCGLTDMVTLHLVRLRQIWHYLCSCIQIQIVYGGGGHLEVGMSLNQVISHSDRVRNNIPAFTH